MPFRNFLIVSHDTGVHIKTGHGIEGPTTPQVLESINNLFTVAQHGMRDGGRVCGNYRSFNRQCEIICWWQARTEESVNECVGGRQVCRRIRLERFVVEKRVIVDSACDLVTFSSVIEDTVGVDGKIYVDG